MELENYTKITKLWRSLSLFENKDHSWMKEKNLMRIWFVYFLKQPFDKIFNLIVYQIFIVSIELILLCNLFANQFQYFAIALFWYHVFFKKGYNNFSYFFRLHHTSIHWHFGELGPRWHMLKLLCWTFWNNIKNVCSIQRLMSWMLKRWL